MTSDNVTSFAISSDDIRALDHPNVEMRRSAFFRNGYPTLPSPEVVRQRAETQNTSLGKLHEDEKDSAIWEEEDNLLWRRPPVIFPCMNLIVKWGGLVRREEGINMYAIKQFLPRIPMPEIYGWRTDGKEVFLYMEYIRGRKFDTVLEEMTHAEHALAVRDLHNMLSDLRLLRQVERDAFVGSIVKTAIYDKTLYRSYIHRHMYTFDSVQLFNLSLSFNPKYNCEDKLCPVPVHPDPHRADLSDSNEVRFTHGDLQPSNVIVSQCRPYRVLAVVDWEEAGWMPEYWEACKALLKSTRVDEWSEMYLPVLFEENDEKVYRAFEWFVQELHRL